MNSGQTPQLPEHHTGWFNSMQRLPFACVIQLNMSARNVSRTWSSLTNLEAAARPVLSQWLDVSERRKPLYTIEVHPRRVEVSVLCVRVYCLLWDTPDRLIWNPEVKKTHFTTFPQGLFKSGRVGVQKVPSRTEPMLKVEQRAGYFEGASAGKSSTKLWWLWIRSLPLYFMWFHCTEEVEWGTVQFWQF